MPSLNEEINKLNTHVSDKSNTSLMPGLPEPLPEIQDLTVSPSDVFICHYRRGNDILTLQFHLQPTVTLTGEIQTSRDQFRCAVERAKIHCERMRYRFLFCRPYITNLEEEEKRMAI